MPRNISFALTTEQIRNRTKTVTRRLGWKNLKPGTILNACVKCMGLKPGEQIERLGQIRVVDVRREPLSLMQGQYGLHESSKEGFPGQSGHKFVSMFCDHMGVTPEHEVTRIEFEYIDLAGNDNMLGEDKKTGRGFELIEFTDRNGVGCSLQQSSAIGDDENAIDNPGSSFVWLGTDDAQPKVLTDAGWVSYPIPDEVLLSTRMHLNREQVEGLVKRLTRWLDTGSFEMVKV